MKNLFHLNSKVMCVLKIKWKYSFWKIDYHKAQFLNMVNAIDKLIIINPVFNFHSICSKMDKYRPNENGLNVLEYYF